MIDLLEDGNVLCHKKEARDAVQETKEAIYIHIYLLLHMLSLIELPFVTVAFIVYLNV